MCLLTESTHMFSTIALVTSLQIVQTVDTPSPVINPKVSRDTRNGFINRLAEYVDQTVLDHPLFLSSRRQERLYWCVIVIRGDTTKRRESTHTVISCLLLAAKYVNAVCILLLLFADFSCIFCRKKLLFAFCCQRLIVLAFTSQVCNFQKFSLMLLTTVLIGCKRCIP